MKKIKVIFSMLIAIPILWGCIFIKGFSTDRNLYLSESKISGSGLNKIAVIDIRGIISDQEKASLLGLSIGENTLYSVVAQLDKIKKDSLVKGLIIKIDSPGGMVTASDIIYKEILKFKTEHKIPVIVCMMDVAASGAYYISMAADKILAHPTTVTGSIGVILENFSVTKLAEKIGVEDRSLTSGPNKDLGSPFKPMTKEQRELLQQIVNQLQDQFIAAVKAGRPNLKEEQIRKLADGRVYTAPQALDAGLIDQIGYFDDAVQLAKKQAGIEKARVILYHPRDLIPQNIYVSAKSPVKTQTAVNVDVDVNLIKALGEPKFLYLWVP